jgi:hypothetical protein
MNARWTQIGLGVVAGGLAALAVGQWNISRLRDADARFRASIKEELAQRDQVHTASIALAGVARAASVAPKAIAPEGAPTPAGSPYVGKPPLATDEIKRGAQEIVAQFHAQAIDQAWAARVTPAFEQDIKRALDSAQAQPKLGAVECRGSSCLGTVEWPSLADARKDMMNVLTADLRVNCPRTAIIQPDAADDGTPVNVDVLFDCTSWKQQGSAIAPL